MSRPIIGPRAALDMERPITEAQELVSALHIIATHPDIADHHGSAINTIAWVIGDRLRAVEELRCACLERAPRVVA